LFRRKRTRGPDRITLIFLSPDLLACVRYLKMAGNKTTKIFWLYPLAKVVFLSLNISLIYIVSFSEKLVRTFCRNSLFSPCKRWILIFIDELIYDRTVLFNKLIWEERKVLRQKACKGGEFAASVLLKLFTNGTVKCYKNDAPSSWAGLFFKCK